MKTTREKIAIMEAFERGEKIEILLDGEKDWGQLRISDPSWNWGKSDYRIAPKPLECWVVWKDDEPLRVTSGSVGYSGGQRLVKMREVIE